MKRVHSDDAAWDIQFAALDVKRESDAIKSQSAGGSKDTRMQRVMQAAAHKRGKGS